MKRLGTFDRETCSGVALVPKGGGDSDPTDSVLVQQLAQLVLQGVSEEHEAEGGVRPVYKRSALDELIGALHLGVSWCACGLWTRGVDV